MADIKNNLNNAAVNLKNQEVKNNSLKAEENKVNYEKFVNSQKSKDEMQEIVMDNSNQKDYTEYEKKDTNSVFGDNFMKKDSVSGYLFAGVIGNQFLSEDKSNEKETIAPIKEDNIKEVVVDNNKKIEEQNIIGKPFSDTNFNSTKVEPKIEVSLNKETLEKRINGKSLKDVLNEINKENLSEQDKVKFYNQFVDASKEHEQKYKIKLLEPPLSLNLNDQVNAIMNSNLKELGDTKSLKVYQTLNKDGKALVGRPELEAEVKNNIKSIIEGYNKGTINQNLEGLKITYNGEDPYNKYPKELLKNVNGVPTKSQLDWLNNNIKDNNLTTNVEKYLKEDQFIFGNSLKNTMKEYDELNKTISMTEKLAAEGKFPQEKVDYLKQARAEIEPDLNDQINKRLKEVGFDLETNLANERKAKELADLAEKERLEQIEKDKYAVNKSGFTDEDRENMHR